MFSIQLIQQLILAIIAIDGDIYSEAERKNGDSNDDLFTHPLGLASPYPT